MSNTTPTPQTNVHAVKPSSMSTASVVLGIIGIIVVPIVCSTLAIVFGAIEWAKAPASTEYGNIRGVPTSWSRGRIGCILGIVGLSAWILLLAVLGG